MKNLRFLVLTVFLSLAVHAPAGTLFDRGDAGWRWRPGTNEASTPVDAWRVNGFNDSQFATAPAPFWYGDVLPGGTQIVGMQNVYLSVFLRKTFVITNLADVGGFRMAALVDDGFVAWINGIEVLRVQVPGTSGSAVTISTLADNAVEPVSYVTYTLPTPPTYLIDGTNVLAVQVFQSALNSSDLGFDMSFESIITETNPPTILSVSPPPGTFNSLTQITVNFSEPVSGVVATHLLVGGIGADIVTQVNSATYTFGFVQPPYGPVPITWVPAHTIVDQALPPNRFNATGPGATWSYTLVDNTPPIVATQTPGAGTTVRSLSSITVLFSESVSGVGASDLLINSIPASGMTPNGASQYVFTFSPPATGTVQVAWAPGHGIIDQAGNPFAGGNWTYIFNPNAVVGSPYISEFMASNTRTNAQNPFSFDWIEIYNPSPLAVNLEGWYLTDSEGDLKKWRFPATNLAGGGFLVVFASGIDQRIPGMQLHTSFQLDASGEYLALVNPQGMVVSDFPAPYALQPPDVSYGFTQTPAGATLEVGTNRIYFTTPTPGAANLGGTAVPGPIIDSVRHTPNVPRDQDDLVVTARVQPSFQAVNTVTLRYRIMYSNELSTPMLDDGAHGDGAAGDGVYGATIPASLSTNGQMIRYVVAATDVSARASRWPIFNNPTNTAEYLGTIVNPTNVTSLLPIFHLFATNGVLQTAPPTSLIGADSEAGGRVSLFYDGEFYDNIYMEIRGNTSAGQNKKSHRLEFNREHNFRHLPGFPRIRKTSLMAEFLDPAYIRQHLSFWLLEQMGMKTPFFYPVRAQLNGSFYGLVFHNDVIGQEQVERMGYDPKGALYKAAGNVLLSRSSTGVFQKLEPDGPPDYTDYNQLVNGIVETATIANRRIAAYDMLDIPEVINYLAGARWCAENDDVWANMSLYRDTYGDQLWRIIPFDMNASWGQRYGGITPLDAINDGCKSHPLYGCSTIIACDGSTYNRMYDVVIMVPELRQMLLRRQRTVLDRWVLEPGVAPESRLLENHIRYMTNLIGTEAVLDRAKWGYSTWTASNKPLGTAIPELFNEFISLRRTHWSATHNVTNVAKPIGVTPTSNAGIPLSQPSFNFLSISNVEFNPSSGNQNQEFIQITNPNNYAVDITGWKLDGAVQFTFKPGTVIPSNSLFYVSPDVLAFKQRTTGPRGGQGNFVVGPYKGQLNARGETLFLFNQNSQLVVSNTYPGNPSPAQLYLRVTEIMYNPARLAGNTNDAQEFEYLELKNISDSVTLNLTGVRLTNGVEFSFTGSAVTSLAPGASVLVVRNMAAFTARYGAGRPVAGQFTGSLDSNGETIRLDDASGEKILEFAFNNTWYPITDGYGFSLVIVDANALWDTWGLKASWRASGALYGSPGNPDPTAPVFAPILVNEILTHTDPPLRDTVELLNPTTNDVNIGGWFLTDDFTNAFKYRFPNPTTIPAGGYLVVSEVNFNPNPGTPPSFAFSSKGDEVLLLSGDANTNLTGYLTFENFGATASGVSLGRYTNSVSNVHFVAQSETTFGGPNAGPRVGPVIVSEINYHPPDLVDGSTRAANNIDEYIELHNISGTPTNLFDPAYPANTWSLRDAVNFTFPQNTVMAAGGYLLVVSFDPADSVALQHFITANSVTPGTPIYGPWEGALDNVEDSVELVRPDAPDPMGPPTYGFVPQILVDEVNYQSLPPWPPGANGIGASISRLNVAAYGNDPANWKAAIKTAGAPTTGGTLPVITAQPADATGVETASAMFSVTATGTAPLGYQWAFNGELIDGAVNSVLVLNNLTTDRAGIYSCYVFNPAGTVLSSNAVLTVNRAATIVNHPVTTMVRVRPDPAAAPTTNATFTVAAVSTTPIRYQWRYNGTNIVGQTNASLTITNVQVKDDGLYGAAITDNVGTVFTTNAPLYALVTPVIFPGLISYVAVTGAPVTLSLALPVGNPPPYTVEWRRGSTPLATNVVNEPADFQTVIAPSPPTANLLYRILVRNLATTGNGVIATNFITSYLDSDGDGIPDPFDANPGLNDATLDSDEDGVNNYAEYVAGTNPNDKFSYLKIDRITAAGGAQLEFYAVSNRTYSVLYKGSLTNPTWSNLSDIAVRLTNRVEQVRDPSPGTNRIYRLVTPKQ